MVRVKEEIRYLPVFLGLTCVYFHEVFLKGAVLAVGDGFDEFFPLMVMMSRQYKDFLFPFWNPYMFSGFPLFGSMQVGALYPFTVVLPLIFSPTAAFNLNLILHYALAGFFTFLYSRQIGLSIFPSLVAGTVFSLLGYLPSHLIHPSIITSATWIPLLLFFYDRLRQKPNTRDAMCASLVIALQIFAGHPQICFYTYLLLLFYVLFHRLYLPPRERRRFVLSGMLPLVLGMLIALPQIVATRELATMGARVKPTYEFFSSYAFPLHMIPTFLFPFFYYYGGSDSGEMWGPIPELGKEAFVGTVPFLLALLVLVRWKKNPHILFWGIIAFAAFALALGDGIRPLNRLLFSLPGYNSFRGPSKHILETSFALSILAGFGISVLQEGEKEKRFHTAVLLVISSVIAISLIAFTLFHDPIRDFFKESFSGMSHFQLHWERADIPEKALSLTDAAVYIPLMTMSAYLAWVYILGRVKKGNLGKMVLSVLFLVLFGEALLYKVSDIPGADTLQNYNKDLYASLASDTSGRTVFFTDKVSLLTAMPYGIRLAEGYDPLATQDYMNMLPPMRSQSPAVCRQLIMNNSLLSMMNVKYLVADNILGNIEDVRRYAGRDTEGRTVPVPPTANPPPAVDYLPIYHKIASFPSFALYENTLALPRAYPVVSLKPADSIDELMRMLFSFQMNPRYEAAVSREDLREIGSRGFSSGDVRVDEEKPDRITLSARFAGKGFVVLADQFYPGWEAYVDGKASRIYRANGVLRGVTVPEGQHTVVFKYVPRLIYASMLVSVIIFIGMVWTLLRAHRQRNVWDNKDARKDARLKNEK